MPVAGLKGRRSVDDAQVAMDEFSALAQRVAVGVGDVRGCLILSRDGLVLGAYPDGDEGLARAAWLRFAALGDPEKSFVEFGAETWAYVRRGGHAAFAVADTSIRPGVLIEVLEQNLRLFEESRMRREPLRVPEAQAAPSGKPRTSLHPMAGRADAPEPAVSQKPQQNRPWSKGTVPPPRETLASTEGDSRIGGGQGAHPPPRPGLGEGEPPDSPESPAPNPGADTTPGPDTDESPPPPQRSEDEAEVDRVSLAREFSGLLQDGSADDEAKS